MKTIKYIPALIAFIFMLPIEVTSQEDAIFKQLVHEYTYHEDGSVDYHHFRELKINSYYAFHRRFGETFIVYNPKHERLSIRDVHTIMKDGTRVDAPKNALNEVLPRDAQNAPDYNSLREMVVTHTGLEQGATIFLDYVKKTFNTEDAFYSGMRILPEAVPVENLVFILRFPLDRGLNYYGHNIDIAPEIDTIDGMLSYRWKLENIPPLENRKFSPATYIYQPSFMWSSSENLQEAWKLWSSQAVFHQDIPAELQIFADSMFNEEDGLDLALSVIDYVKRTTVIWPLDVENTGFQPRPALQCWKSSGGTALEFAMLNIQLMKAAGLDVNLAVAVHEKCYQEGLAIRQCWDHPIIHLKHNSDIIWLDPLKENTFSADASLAGMVLLPILPDGQLEAQKVEEQMAAAQLTFDLNFIEDGVVKGSFAGSLSGSANPWFNESAIKSAYKIDGYTSEAVMDDWKIDKKESAISFSLDAIDSLEQFGELYKIELPYPRHGADHILHSRLPGESNLGVELPYPMNIRVEWNLELPEGYTLLVTEAKLGAGGSVGLMSQLVNQKGKRWQITRQLEIPREIDAEGYTDFQDIVNMWTDPDLRTFWIKKEKEQE